MQSNLTEGNKNTNEKKKKIPFYLSDTEIPFCNAVSNFGGSDTQDELALYCNCVGRSDSYRFCYQSVVSC